MMAIALHTDTVIVSMRPAMDYARMFAECIIVHMEQERAWAIDHFLGKADWVFDDDPETWGPHGIHIPCCSRMKGNPRVPGDYRKCGNGPLTGDQILSGDCGLH